MERGREHLESKRFSEAVACYSRITEKHPNNIWALCFLVKSQFLNGMIFETIPPIIKRISIEKEKHDSDNFFINTVNELLQYTRKHAVNKPCLLHYGEFVEKLLAEWYTTADIDLGNVNFSSSFPVEDNLKDDNLSPRVAVLIAGQFRGHQYSIPSIRRFISGVNCDLYISAWDRFGFRDITSDKRSYKHLERTFDAHFCNLVNELNVDLTGYIDSITNLRSHLGGKLTKEFVLEKFSDATVEILNEELFEKDNSKLESKLLSFYPKSKTVFANSINMMKMVFANYSCLQQAKNSNIRYTHIVKIRPDFVISSNRSLAELMENIALKKSYCFVDDWGGEVSDQFFLGEWDSDVYYNDLWNFWSQMEKPISDIGNLNKPHKRIKDYLAHGKIKYIFASGIRDSLDSSNRISKSNHIEIIRQNYSEFEKIATPSHIELVRSYLETEAI